MERQYLADLTALSSAAYAAGQEVELPSWEARVAELDADLMREPVPVSERDRFSRTVLRELGVA